MDPDGWGHALRPADWGGAAPRPATTVCVMDLPGGITPREFRFVFKFAVGLQRCTILLTLQGEPVGYARFHSPHHAHGAIERLQGLVLDDDFPIPVKAFLSAFQLPDADGPEAEAPPLLAHGWPIMGANATDGASGPEWGAAAVAADIRGRAPRATGGGGGGGGGDAQGASVYVGGVPKDWEEAAVRDLFAPLGRVTKVHLALGRYCDKIAFVHFATVDEAQAAIDKMNYYVIDETRYLTVRSNTSAQAK